MLVGSVCAQAHELWGGTVTFPAGRLTSRLAGVLVVGVLGLVASYSLLFEDLMSKLMGLLIVGVLRPSAFRPSPPRTSHEQARGRPRRRGGGI